MKLELAARQLESLGSPVRLKLYRALVRAGEDGLAVGAIQAKLGSRRRRCRITCGISRMPA